MKAIIVSKNLGSFEDKKIKSELEKEFGKFEFILVKPREDTYKISEIKEFIKSLQTKKSNVTEKFFYVFTKGEDLSPICQNALLKTLEESPYHLGIITKNESALLHTIRSRSQTYFISTETSEKKKDSEVLSFDQIGAISKMERKDVIDLIEHKMYTIAGISPTLALSYQDAISKLEANTKIEAVLFELVHNLKLNEVK